VFAMADMFSYVILLQSVITNIPCPWLFFHVEMQKNLITVGLFFTNLITNTVNPLPLTEVHRFTSPLLKSDYFEPLAVLMWAILKKL
jgi:hypothetical protein